MPEPASDTVQHTSLSERIRRGEIPVVVTASMQEKLEKSTGFQHLVSYTDGGFEPAELTIKRGETIRFTNNSSDALWVAASGERRYPGTNEECGASALDSCGAVAPLDFWEVTLTERGKWEFTNNLDKSERGSVTVEAI